MKKLNINSWFFIIFLGVITALIIIGAISIKEESKKKATLKLYSSSTFKEEDEVKFLSNDRKGHIISLLCSLEHPECLYQVRLDSTLEIIKDVKNFEILRLSTPEPSRKISEE